MKAEYQITLTLSDEEAATLVKLLGGLDDFEFEEHGYSQAEIDLILEVRDALEEMGAKE